MYLPKSLPKFQEITILKNVSTLDWDCNIVIFRIDILFLNLSGGGFKKMDMMNSSLISCGLLPPVGGATLKRTRCCPWGPKSLRRSQCWPSPSNCQRRSTDGASDKVSEVLKNSLLFGLFLICLLFLACKKWSKLIWLKTQV